jgi:hypothetical protein
MILLVVVLFFIITSLSANPYPADVTFCVADLKYDGQILKICEFGQGTVSQFNGYDALYGYGSMFAQAWSALHTLHPKLILMNPRAVHYRPSQSYALDTLKRLKTRMEGSQESLVRRDAKHDKYHPNVKKVSSMWLHDYDGIIITLNTNDLHRLMKSPFRKDFVRYLILDKSTTSIVNHKVKTNSLFDDQWLALFRPRCMVCKKVYDKRLIERIKMDMPSKIYVIKPINASEGRGVIIVTEKELAKTLRLILLKSDQLTNYDANYQYWLRDANETLLIETFAVSKTIVVDEKPFDPTMRVTFILWNDGGQPHVIFLDAYWKLPQKSLNEAGTLTEQHKSHVSSREYSSVELDKQDFKQVTAMLEPLLLRIYENMLAKANNVALAPRSL